MTKRLLLLALLALACFTSGYSQLLTWTPDFAKEGDNITITVDATKGNQGLLNFSGNVYVHIGLITSSSTNAGDWKYAPFAWASTTAAAQASPAGTNKWSYTINNIRSFFNVTNAGESIKAIAILFRDGPGNLVQRNSNTTINNGDMYVPVYDNGLHVRFTQPPWQPYYIPVPEAINKSVGDNISVTGIANQPSVMKLYLNGTEINTANSVTTLSANPTLTAGGNTEIVVEANNGTTIKKDTLRFFVSGGVTTAPLPAGVKDGINYDANNTSVTLVLYASNKNRVSVIGEFPGNNWTEQTTYQMNKTPDGNYWWIRIDGLTAGIEYAFQYLVDGTLKVADPYTEKVLDPADVDISASVYPGLRSYPAGQAGIISIVQTAAPQYTWQNTTFTGVNKRNLIIYELLMRDFTDAHHWQVMIDTLSYLKRLGITAIELLPVTEFEGNDSWGYNPSYSFAPDKYYGPKNKLKQFIDSCHGKGIAVIMDVVPNHVYSQSPLAQLYWNPALNRPAANNPWLNQVQPHAFGFGHDFNHESNATKYFWRRMFDFWLREYKMDGYRMDFTKGLTQTPSADDGQFSAYDQSRVNILKDYADSIWKYFPDAYIILEHLASAPEEQALQNMGFLMWSGKQLNERYNETTMGYHDNNKSNISSIVYNSTERGFSNPHLVGYMESHDEERLMYKNVTFGNSTSVSYDAKNDSIALRRMEAAYSLFLTIPGPKMIWEFGERGYNKSIMACPDGSIPQPYPNNESCKLSRKEPRWQHMQDIKRQRLYDVVAALIKLRNTQPALFNSTDFSYNLVDPVKFFKIAEPNLAAVIIANFGVTASNTAVTFQNSGIWYDYLTGATITATGAAQAIALLPGEYHVYLNKNITNVITTPVFDINVPLNTLEAALYPNPADNSSVLELNIPEAGKVQVDLYSITGIKLNTVYTGSLVRGVHFLPLLDKINNLPGGMYVLQVQAKNKSRTVKMIIQ
jgi:1,4-alpha-glucan branching enzyme